MKKNLISLQITASGFSPQAQGLKRKENFSQRIGIQGYSRGSESGDFATFITRLAIKWQALGTLQCVLWCPPGPPQSLSEQLVLLQQLQSSLPNRSHPPCLVWAPELGWCSLCSSPLMQPSDGAPRAKARRPVLMCAPAEEGSGIFAHQPSEPGR